MLNSSVLRRALAVAGLGAAGIAPVIPFAAVAFFGAAVPTANVVAAPTPGDPIPNINPGDIDDGTGGIGILPIFPPFIPPPYPSPDDIDDATGGVGGIMP